MVRNHMKEHIPLLLSSIAIILSVIALVSPFFFDATVLIHAGQIGENELSDSSVTSEKIKDLTISNDDISESGISKIAEDSITSRQILRNSIKLIDLDQEILDAITGVDIANGSISSEKLADDSITSDKIADGSITNEKLASDAVTWTDISGKPMEVFAAGYIKSDTTVEYGYNVDSVTYDGSTKFYTIYTDGYDFNDKYITIVSTYTGASYEDVVHSVYGPTIWLHDIAGNYVQADFYFVTYKIN